jgi:glycosyltransferase involved in cell wall biosynthesis
MRLAVVNLTSGGFSGGYRKYLSRLMPLLANDPRVSALSVFVPERVGIELDSGIDVRTWPRSERNLTTLRRDLAARGPDVVFVPTARHLTFGGVPVVVMVRNMEPLEVPFGGNTWAEGLRNVARAWEARRACLRATRVIAVSDHVRRFIISRWHIDEDRIGTVYHGVDGRGPSSRPDDDTTDRRTLFTAGSIRPARGLEDVIRALPLVDRDVRLVIAGQVDPGCEGYAAGLRRLCNTLGVADRVTFAGQLGSSEIAEALHGSAAFVMTSRAEACPNTALEAMSCGSVIVSVDRPPMPEFFREAALYYPVAAAEPLARQLHAILADPAARDRLARAALRRAADFSWEATRDRTIQELERARS